MDSLDAVSILDEVSQVRIDQAQHLQSVCQEMGLLLDNDLALRAVDHQASRGSSVQARASILVGRPETPAAWDREITEVQAALQVEMTSLRGNEAFVTGTIWGLCSYCLRCQQYRASLLTCYVRQV